MAWTLRGDPDVAVTTSAGVTYGLNNTERTFEEMRFSGWSLKFAHLADDVFTYTVPTYNAKGLGAIIPRDGQEIHVYKDGVRKFKGHVVRPKLGLSSLQVSAYGPFWWMSKISLSSLVKDSTGVLADRTSFIFPQQGLRISLRTLINRAAAMGVPMDPIDTDYQEEVRISSMFTMLPTTLSNMSFAAALTELLSVVPDAVAWWNYEANPLHLRITRRGDMAALGNLVVGSTGDIRVESADIAPRTDQQVRRVDLKYVTRRLPDGLPKWANKGSGSITTQEHRKQHQIITVSGPETLAFAPKDDFDSTTLKTKNTLTTADFFKLDPILAGSLSYGSFTGKTNGWIAPGWAYITSGKTLDWMRKDLGLQTKEFTLQGWFKGTFVSSQGLGSAANYLKSIGRASWAVGGATSNAKPFSLYVNFKVTLINLSYPKKTTVYKKWDYKFIEPPDGLAENLKDAQNWLPWEGQVVIARPTLTGDNHLNRTINLANSHPDHASMNALLRSVTYDGTRHRVIYDLGPPARADLGTLVNKLRRNPQDNIVWL